MIGMAENSLFTPSMRIGKGKFFQQAFLVEDIDAAMKYWTDCWGIGPFFIIRHAKWENLRYRGQPVEVDASFAMAQAGPLQIELCAQHNVAPSCYRDMFQPGQEGFHHLAMVVDNYDVEIARLKDVGFEVAMEGTFGEMQFAYVDTRTVSGFMTEIVSNWGPVGDTHRMVADASIGWDGRDPVRDL